MQAREPSGGQQPEPHTGNAGPSYAPETSLVPGAARGALDEEVKALVVGLPDGVGPLQRIGICNPAGAVYREISLHGPLQLLHLWARLNALGFRQQGPQGRGFSKYTLLFTREEP